MCIDVSFVLTVYNKNNYLEHTIRSLQNQKGDFSWEFVFVDDFCYRFSCDGMALIVGQLEVFDHRAVFVFSSSGSQVHAYIFSVYIPAYQPLLRSSGLIPRRLRRS